jgi:predicted glycoside hydrolase/deacetylase ChbG (UPF0249 family)
VTRRLIVNADDYGRTAGINAGVLEAHRDGIVTSATVMVLEPAAEEGIRSALATAPRLGLGLHVVLTGGGPPASPPEALPALAPGGRFARNADAMPRRLPPEEIAREIEAQIARFESIAGRLPSHLDSHHHSALHPDVEPVFAEAARRRGLPVRASDGAARERLRAAGLRTPDAFLDRFFGAGATAENLREILETLPEGTSELMCHPGHSDEALARGSTYARERERETEILRAPELPALLRRLGVEPIPFERL